MIFRIEKNKYYSVMSNYHLRDKRLTLQAKGLLSLILSFPDNCDFKQYDIEQFTINGEKAVLRAINELITYGYLIKDRFREKNGRFNTIYTVFECPNNEEPHDILQGGKCSMATINKVNRYINTNNKIRNSNSKKSLPDWLEEYQNHFEETIDNL